MASPNGIFFPEEPSFTEVRTVLEETALLLTVGIDLARPLFRQSPSCQRSKVSKPSVFRAREKTPKTWHTYEVPYEWMQVATRLLDSRPGTL